MRFIALILVLIAPSLATASEKIYEDLLYDIRAFHCNAEEEKSPYIFIFTDRQLDKHQLKIIETKQTKTYVRYVKPSLAINPTV